MGCEKSLVLRCLKTTVISNFFEDSMLNCNFLGVTIIKKKKWSSHFIVHNGVNINSKKQETHNLSIIFFNGNKLIMELKFLLF